MEPNNLRVNERQPAKRSIRKRVTGGKSELQRESPLTDQEHNDSLRLAKRVYFGDFGRLLLVQLTLLIVAGVLLGLGFGSSNPNWAWATVQRRSLVFSETGNAWAATAALGAFAVALAVSHLESSTNFSKSYGVNVQKLRSDSNTLGKVARDSYGVLLSSVVLHGMITCSLVVLILQVVGGGGKNALPAIVTLLIVCFVLLKVVESGAHLVGLRMLTAKWNRSVFKAEHGFQGVNKHISQISGLSVVLGLAVATLVLDLQAYGFFYGVIVFLLKALLVLIWLKTLGSYVYFTKLQPRNIRGGDYYLIFMISFGFVVPLVAFYMFAPDENRVLGSTQLVLRIVLLACVMTLIAFYALGYAGKSWMKNLQAIKWYSDPVNQVADSQVPEVSGIRARLDLLFGSIGRVRNAFSASKDKTASVDSVFHTERRKHRLKIEESRVVRPLVERPQGKQSKMYWILGSIMTSALVYWSCALGIVAAGVFLLLFTIASGFAFYFVLRDRKYQKYMIVRFRGGTHYYKILACLSSIFPLAIFLTGGAPILSQVAAGVMAISLVVSVWSWSFGRSVLSWRFLEDGIERLIQRESQRRSRAHAKAFGESGPKDL